MLWGKWVKMAKKLELNDDLIKKLVPYFQSGHLNFIIGSGASFPAIQLAGNIESEINALIALDEEHEANVKAIEFAEQILAKHFANPKHAQTITTEENYKNFLNNLDTLLYNRHDILIPKQASIFTTNYDMFIEGAASGIPSIILNDGFDRSTLLNGKYRLAPDRYYDRVYRSGAVFSRQTEVPTINLIKLHGSLNWERSDAEIFYRFSQYTYLSTEQKQNQGFVKGQIEKFAMILPSLRKFGSTLLDRTYYDLLRLYSNSLDKENSLLAAFGFSFADDHILDITKRALRNPTLQLIIFGFDANSVAIFEQKFSSNKNVTIIAPPTDSNIGFAEFNQVLKTIATGEGT